MITNVSSKRCRTDALGSYGLGSKAGLATGADFYKLVSVYNGVRYSFKVFNRKMISEVPAYDFINDRNNIECHFEGGDVYYGEPTTEKNGVSVEIPFFKHNKQDVEKAIRDQLMYFPQVKFFVQDIYGNLRAVDVYADIMYNSSNIIISKNSPYTKPHIVITKSGSEDEVGVVYGEIDFQELELEDINGPIGIKCPIRQVIEHEDGSETVINEGVSVVPSRESVKWDANTKAFVQKRFSEAKHEATKIVEDKLKQTDFIEWLKACVNISDFKRDRNSPLSVLANIVDLSSVTPKFKQGDISVTYGSPNQVFSGFLLSSIQLVSNVAQRNNNVSWGNINWDKVIIQDEKFDERKARFLKKTLGDVTFFTLMTDAKFKEYDDKVKGLAMYKGTTAEDRIAAHKNISMWMYNNLINAGATKLSTVTVPDDFDVVSGTDTSIVTKEPTPEELRALNAQTVCHTFALRSDLIGKTGSTFKFDKREPKISDVLSYKGALYYGYKEDEEKLQFISHILDKTCEQTNGDSFYGPNYRIVMVAQNQKKHFKGHKHVDRFFGELTPIIDPTSNKQVGNEIVMDAAIVNWYTARKIHESLKSLEFLENFSIFNNVMTDTYEELKTYVSTYYTPLDGYRDRTGMAKHYDNFLNYLGEMEHLQELVESGASNDDIADYCKDATFIPKESTKGIVVNRDYLNKMEELLSYASSIKDLLNHIPALCKKGVPINQDLVYSIKDYLNLKNA